MYCLFALHHIFEFQTFLHPKIALQPKFWPRNESPVLYGDVVICAMRRLSRGKKKGLKTRKVFSHGEFTNFWLARYFEASILIFFLRKKILAIAMAV